MNAKSKRIVDSKCQACADNDNDPKSWWLMENTIAGFDKYREEQNAAEKFDYDAPVEGMKVINDYEFEITLQEPVYRFLYTLAMFQLAVVPREAVEMYGSKFDLHPVGTMRRSFSVCSCR